MFQLFDMIQDLGCDRDHDRDRDRDRGRGLASNPETKEK